MALFFNSLTGKIEDDGKDIQAPDTFSIPSGRGVDPTGGQDIKIPMGGIPAQQKYERQLAKQQSLSMLADPESAKFAQIADLNNMIGSLKSPKAEIPQSEEFPTSPTDTAAPIPKKANRAPAVVPNAQEMPQDASQKVREYIKAKYGLIDPEAYDAQMVKAQADAKERKSGLGLAQFAAGLGDSLAGRNPAESAKNFQTYRENIDKETVGNLESRRKAQMDNLSGNSMLQKMQRDDDVNNPNSAQSQAFRKIIESKFPDVARSYGKDWANVSAADQDLIFKPLQLKEQIDSRRANTELIVGQRNEARREKAEEKLNKKKTSMYEIEERRQNILSNLAELDTMIDEDGTWEAFGSHNQDMDRKIDQVATDMAKLMDHQSVARPAEVEQIKKSLIKPGFSNRNGTARKLIENFKSEVNRRADSAYQIRGLEKPQEVPTTSQPETKVINGKTYKRVQGGWEEVG